MIQNPADKEAIRVMTEELRELEQSIAQTQYALSDDFFTARERAIELRKRLGLPEKP